MILLCEKLYLISLIFDSETIDDTANLMSSIKHKSLSENLL